VVLPKRSGHHAARALDDVGRIAGGFDRVRSGAVRIEAGSDVGRKVLQRRRQIAQYVERAAVDECTFPVDAPVEEVGRLLDCTPYLVSAVRGTDRECVARVLVVVPLDSFARGTRGLHDARLPFGKRLGSVIVVEVRKESRERRGRWLDPASEWV